MISHKKAFGVYHWDTFDNETLLIFDGDSLPECEQWVAGRYTGRIRPSGADQVDIVNQEGVIVRNYKVG